eukprot:gene4082-4329_t
MVDCAALEIIESCHPIGSNSTPVSVSAGRQQLGSSIGVPQAAAAGNSCNEVGFAGLDVANPQHLLLGIAAVNHVLFIEQALCVNTEDFYDPLNGSLAHMINTKKGNPHSLVIVYLHVAAALGLPCAIVGSPNHPLIRVGIPRAGSTTGQSSTPQTAAVFLVDVAEQGKVYWYGGAGLQSWNDVSWYAAADAASSSTWKFFYGLSPQPGSVAGCPSSTIADQLNNLHSAAGQGGVLASPFASLAWKPFPEEDFGSDAQRGLSGAVSDSLESVCGSADSTGIDIGSSGTASSQAAIVVHHLTPDDLVKFGGLQPVSCRVLLQQLLRGMVLPLTMSSRLEDGLLLLRYLRATDPFSLPDLRDEALTLMQLQRPEEAAPLLREYLALAPGAPDADMAQEVLLQAQLLIEISRRRAGQ